MENFEWFQPETVTDVRGKKSKGESFDGKKTTDIYDAVATVKTSDKRECLVCIREDSTGRLYFVFDGGKAVEQYKDSGNSSRYKKVFSVMEKIIELMKAKID